MLLPFQSFEGCLEWGFWLSLGYRQQGLWDDQAATPDRPVKMHDSCRKLAALP